MLEIFCGEIVTKSSLDEQKCWFFKVFHCSKYERLIRIIQVNSHLGEAQLHPCITVLQVRDNFWKWIVTAPNFYFSSFLLYSTDFLSFLKTYAILSAFQKHIIFFQFLDRKGHRAGSNSRTMKAHVKSYFKISINPLVLNFLATYQLSQTSKAHLSIPTLFYTCVSTLKSPFL